MVDKRFVNWKEYIPLLDSLVKNVREDEDIQVIVGLTRGELIPAIYLSHALDIPMITFEPHQLHSSGDERMPLYLPISPPIIKHLIIVDDIADTGKTFTKCTKFFKKRGFNFTTASVFINRTKTSYEPSWPGEDSKNKWIVFPYEVS